MDHTLYDTAAMVRTMGLILGTKPMSQFDANAMPMWRLFHAGADLRPFTARPETFGLASVNTASSPGAALSASWGFEQEDQAPMDQLNQVIWQAVKGPESAYPGPAGSGAATGEPGGD